MDRWSDCTCSHSSPLNTLLGKREIRATIYWTVQTEMEFQFTGKTGFVQFSWALKFIFGKTTVPLQHSLMCNNVFKSSSEKFLRAPWRTPQSCLFGHWPPLTSHCFTFLSRHPELHLAVWDHCHEKSVANQKISRWRCTMAQTLKVHFYIQKTTWHEFLTGWNWAPNHDRTGDLIIWRTGQSGHKANTFL